MGVSWYLAHAPGELGTHLALTGATVNATDAVLVGLSDEVAGEAPASELERDRAWIEGLALDEAVRRLQSIREVR